MKKLTAKERVVFRALADLFERDIAELKGADSQRTRYIAMNRLGTILDYLRSTVARKKKKVQKVPKNDG